MSIVDHIYRMSSTFMPLRRFSHDAAFGLEMLILYSFKKDRNTLALIRRIKRESDLFLTADEAFLLHSLARTQRQLAGDMAELGVYKGGSARLICEAKGRVPLHLFDTFDGLPEPGDKDDGFFKQGMVTGRLSAVRNYLKSYESVFFYPGLFPGNLQPVQDKLFSFVHLDVDLYQGTLSGLEFFYPRMSAGGIILTHDYQYPGVRKAFAEFFEGQPGQVVELGNSQCMAIKR